MLIRSLQELSDPSPPSHANPGAHSPRSCSCCEGIVSLPQSSLALVPELLVVSPVLWECCVSLISAGHQGAQCELLVLTVS